MSFNLEYILENSAGNLYWKDRQGRYLGANKTYTKLMLSQSNQNFIGKTDREIYASVMSDEQLKTLENIDQRIMTNGKEENIKEVGVNIAGELAIYITKKIPIRDENNAIIGILGTSLDITKEVDAEKRAKASEVAAILAKNKAEKEQEMRNIVMVLVGDIVHDLRTPMTTIGMGADILESISPELKDVIQEARELKLKKLEEIDETQLDYVLNKMSSIQKKYLKFMRQFINTTLKELTLAQKYQDGEIAYDELHKCSSQRVLDNVMDAYQHNQNIIINQNFSSYDFIFMGNAILMMKVLFNLIKNAKEQIIANGKGEITISTQEYDEINLIIIKDTAGGAPPEITNNFFKDFFTTKTDGTGIGLAFCKKIMKNFGGDLSYHSIFGESIEFILSFPKISDTTPYNSIPPNA